MLVMVLFGEASAAWDISALTCRHLGVNSGKTKSKRR
jgi:hypothetical protein